MANGRDSKFVRLVLSISSHDKLGRLRIRGLVERHPMRLAKKRVLSKRSTFHVDTTVAQQLIAHLQSSSSTICTFTLLLLMSAAVSNASTASSNLYVWVIMLSISPSFLASSIRMTRGQVLQYRKRKRTSICSKNNSQFESTQPSKRLPDK